MKTMIAILAFTLVLTMSAIAQDYALQIQWGLFITDSGWKDIESSYDIAFGTAPPAFHAGKLGEQHSIFQLNAEQMIIFTFNISALPYNLAYNLPNKRVKVYTNVYWTRFNDGSGWSAPSDWVAITYVK